MRVILAEAMGMCFGVRDALEVAERFPDPAQVTIHGELVHNEQVGRALETRGFSMTAEASRTGVPDTPFVLITAHGVSLRERRRLEERGKVLIDTTCPLVARAHDAATRLQSAGFHVLIIGRRGHVEVEGLRGDLESSAVIEEVGDVATYPHDRLGVISQTTSTARDVERICRAIEELNRHADIRFIDTVCQPTKDRQLALERLLAAVDIVLVVGGRNSNNTRKLVARARESGLPAYHVTEARDVDPEWFRGSTSVGITAGTSTLDAAIDEVYRAVLRLSE